jgi:hypothetical protein
LEHLRRRCLSALTTFGKRIRDLKLERDPPEVDDLGDGITAPEVIRDVHLIPGFLKVDGYSKMMRYIEETFDVGRGYTDARHLRHAVSGLTERPRTRSSTARRSSSST